MTRALVAAVVALAVSPAAAGPCLVDGIAPMILTPAGATIDQFGGIVVAALSSSMHRDQHADVSAQPWKLQRDGTRTKAKVTKLAPGLALYAAPDHGQGIGAKVTLEDSPDHAAVEVVLGFMNTRDMPMDPAPQVTALTHTKEDRMPLLSTEATVATLKAPPPPGTVALLVYDARPKGKLARSFVLVTDPKATTITIYGRHKCEAEVPGTVPTRSGHTVRLAWVDAEGHISLLSDPVRAR